MNARPTSAALAFLLSLLLGFAAPPALAAPTLSAHYKFDDSWGAGDVLDDNSGQGKHATLGGAVAQESSSASGIKPATGKAGNLNKTGWFNAPSLDIDTTAGGKNSVSFWMYWDGGFSDYNFTMPLSWGGTYYALVISKYRSEMGNGVIGFNTGNGDAYGVSADGLANGWHHVVAVFSNGDVAQNRLYIDGVQKTLTSYGGQSTRSATTSPVIGSGWDGNSYKWSGKLDNFKIYKGEITAAQIAADMAETSPAPVLPVNVAMNKAAKQSSTWQDNSAYGAGKSVDGDGTTYPHTKGGQSDWWEVDLGAYYKVSEIKIFQGNCCNDRLNNTDIMVSAYPLPSGPLNAAEIKAYKVGTIATGQSTNTINASDAVGRYVRVQLQGNSYLHMAEAQVYGVLFTGTLPPKPDLPVNLALNKTATQSSTWQGNAAYGASKSVDGDASTFPHTAGGQGDWWEVDLGANYALSEIVIRNGNCCNDRLNNTDILVSSSPFPARPLNATEIAAARKGTITTGQSVNTITPSNAIGRYVRVQLQGISYLHMAEVEVYGTAAAAPPPTDPLLVDDDKAQCPTAGSTTIADALTAAKAGDTITVCPGTYNGAITVNTSGLTINGSTGVAADVKVNATGAGNAVFAINAASVTLKGMTLNNPDGFGVAGVDRLGPHTFENLVVSAGKYGFYLTGVSNVATFKSVAVTTTSEMAIYFDDKSTGAHVLEGVTAIGGSWGVYAGKGVASLTNVNAEGKSKGGIAMGNAQATVFNNVKAISSGVYDHGIFISASDTTNHPYTFTKVTASGKSRGINIARSGKVTMTDVTATSTGDFDSAIYLDTNADGAHVFDNVTATGNGGITLQRGAASLKNITATGTSGSAIWMGNKYATTLDTVTANAPNHRGIEIANTDAVNNEVTFTNVKVTSKSRGINVARSGKVKMNNITVNTPDVGIFLDAEAKGGHELTNLDLTAGNGAIIADGAAKIEDFKATTGIFIGTAQDVVIRRGLISSSIGMGIQINGTDKKKVTVEDVTIKTGWQYGFMLMKASEALVQRVCVSGMSTAGIYTTADNVTIRDSQFSSDGSSGGVMTDSAAANKATVTNNAFLKPAAWSNSTAHTFNGNYWQGIAGGTGYTAGYNVTDNKTLAASPVTGCYPNMSPPLPPPQPPAILIADWRMDETSWNGTAGEVKDASGNNRHGKAVGTPMPTTVAGKVCSAATHPGPVSNGGAFEASGLPVSTTAGDKTTVAFWMYWDGTPDRMPIGFNGYDLYFGGAYLGFNTGNGGDVFGAPASALANGWHHVTAIFTNGNVSANELYFDGVKQTLTQRDNQPRADAVVSSTLSIGGWPNNTYYRPTTSRVDEVKVWSGALTAAQVAAGYANEAAGKNWDGLARTCAPVIPFLVDDDKKQCPTAGYTTVSAAVAAAKSGDTITICPGAYNEAVTLSGKSLALVSSTNNKADVTISATSGAVITTDSPTTVKNLTLSSTTNAVNGISACPSSAATLALTNVDINVTSGSAIFQNTSGNGCQGLALNLTGVTAGSSGAGNGIVLNNGAGEHVLANVSATGGDTGWNNYAAIRIQGGSSFTATNLNVTYNGQYSSGGNNAALWLQGIAGNISITANDGKAHDIKTTGGGNYGLYVCPSAAATLTLKGAGPSTPYNVSATNGSALFQNTSGYCSALTLDLANLSVTSTIRDGISINNGAGAHVLNHMSISGSSEYSPLKILGGSGATLTDVDVTGTRDYQYGYLVNLQGMTGGVTFNTAQKSRVNFVNTVGRVNGIYVAAAAGSTIPVTLSNVSVDVTETSIASGGGGGWGKYTLNATNVTTSARAASGINWSNGAGNHVVNNATLFGKNGWGRPLSINGGADIAITDVDATQLGTGPHNYPAMSLDAFTGNVTITAPTKTGNRCPDIAGNANVHPGACIISLDVAGGTTSTNTNSAGLSICNAPGATSQVNISGIYASSSMYGISLVGGGNCGKYTANLQNLTAAVNSAYFRTTTATPDTMSNHYWAYPVSINNGVGSHVLTNVKAEGTYAYNGVTINGGGATLTDVVATGLASAVSITATGNVTITNPTWAAANPYPATNPATFPIRGVSWPNGINGLGVAIKLTTTNATTFTFQNTAVSGAGSGIGMNTVNGYEFPNAKLVMSNVTVDAAKGDGVSLGYGTGQAHALSNVTVVATRTAMHLGRGTGATLSGLNLTCGNDGVTGGYGLSLESTSNLTLSGTNSITCKSPNSEGIHTYGCDTCTLSGAIIDMQGKVGTHGIYTDHNGPGGNWTITGNHIKNAARYGIDMYGYPSAVTNNIVENSGTESGYYGIAMERGQGAAYNNCVYTAGRDFTSSTSLCAGASPCSTIHPLVDPKPSATAAKEGNFWGSWPKGTGFSDTCADANSDGLCDAATGGDNAPLKVCRLTSPGTPPPSSALVGDWRMNETAWSGAGSVIDAAGGDNNGTPANGASIQSCTRGGTAGKFSAAARQYVEVADNDAFSEQATSGKFTAGGWFRVEEASVNSDYNTLIGKGGEWRIQLIGNRVYLTMYQNGGSTHINHSIDLKELAWADTVGAYYLGDYVNKPGFHFVGISYDKPANKINFFVVRPDPNDQGNSGSASVLTKTYTYDLGATGNSYNGTAPVRLGASGDANYFDGVMRGVFHAKGVLSEADLLAHARATWPTDDCPATAGATLVADWRMDEPSWNGTAGEVRDGSGNNLNGVALNGAATTDNKLCVGGVFDGVNDYVSTSQNAKFNEGKVASIAFWIKAPASTKAVNVEEPILSKLLDWNSPGWMIKKKSTSRQLQIDMNTSAGASAYRFIQADVLDNTWHHVAVIMANGSVSAYVDGAPATMSNSTYLPGNGFGNSYGPNIGKDLQGGNYLTGKLDEVKLWNGALTANQIKAGYDNERAGKNWDGTTRTCATSAATLSAHYKFDDTWSASDTLEDSSGKDKHATLTRTVTREDAPAAGGKPDTCQAGNFNKAGYFTTASGLDVDTATDAKNSVSLWMYWDGGFDAYSFTMLYNWSTHYSLGVSKYRGDMGNGVIGFNTEKADIFGVSADGLANGWHHVAAVFNNGDITKSKLYIDGELKTLKSYGSHDPKSAGTGSAIIGAGKESDYEWSGKIDNVKIYKGEISAAQIAADMAEAGNCPRIVADYRMDETSWNGSAGEVVNSSSGAAGSYASGKATGGASPAPGKVCNAGGFAGDKQFVQIDTPVNLRNFTYMAWVNDAAIGKGGWRSIIDVDNDKQLLGVKGSSYRLFGRCQDIEIATESSGWHHIAWTVLDGNYAVYVDGVKVKSGDGCSRDVTGSGLAIGSGQGGNEYWSGQIDEVKIWDGALTAEVVKASFDNESAGKNWDGTARTCPATGPDHYRLMLPSRGAACMSHEVKVVACKDADCSAKFAEAKDKKVILATTAGTLNPIEPLLDEQGEAKSMLKHAEALNGASVTVSLTDAQVKAQNPARCCPDGTACQTGSNCTITLTTDPVLVFTNDPRGETAVSPPTQISGIAGTHYLRAVQTDGTRKCVPAASGSKLAGMTYTCNDPATCTSGKWMTVNGVSFEGASINGPGGATNVPLEFNATTGAAPIAITFNDAGKIHMSAEVSISGFAAKGNTPTPFLVKPAALCVYSDVAACTKPAGSEHECDKVKKAGEPFKLTVAAVNNSNASCATNTGVTPNFRLNGITLGSALVAPSGGVAGTVGKTSMNITVNGWGEVADQSISEVGVFKFSATAPKYFDETIGTSSGKFESGAIGRFIPDHFAIASGALTPGCGTAFTYLGQDGFSTAFTITAQNTANGPTNNYVGNFAKLGSPSWAALAFTASGLPAGSALSASAATPAPSVGTWANGSASVTAKHQASRPASHVSPATNVIVSARPIDSDGVTLPASVAVNSTAAVLRFGRLWLGNAYGSDKQSLQVRYETQYWNGSTFIKNAEDGCTSFVSGSIGLGNYQGGITSANMGIDRVTVGAIDKGTGFITLSNAGLPTAGASGSVDLVVDLGSTTTPNTNWVPIVMPTAGANMPWLRGKWYGTAWDRDPPARATFGIFGSSSKRGTIYLRESY